MVKRHYIIEVTDDDFKLEPGDGLGVEIVYGDDTSRYGFWEALVLAEVDLGEEQH